MRHLLSPSVYPISPLLPAHNILSSYPRLTHPTQKAKKNGYLRLACDDRAPKRVRRGAAAWTRARHGPKPEVIRSNYKGSSKLAGQVAIITGADSGIGRAVAVHYAREGAKGLTISYLDEHKDAQETKRMVEEEGCQAILMAGDVGDDAHCKDIVDLTLKTFGRLDCLVNSAAEQHVCNSLLDITKEQLERTFRTNIFAYFYMAQAALPYLGEGSSIINTTSVTAYKGHKTLLDYSSTKGAIVSFTRSLSLQLADKKIRVNGVAPGPIWTPLIPATFLEDTRSWKGSAHGT